MEDYDSPLTKRHAQIKIGDVSVKSRTNQPSTLSVGQTPDLANGGAPQSEQIRFAYIPDMNTFVRVVPDPTQQEEEVLKIQQLEKANAMAVLSQKQNKKTPNKHISANELFKRNKTFGDSLNLQLARAQQPPKQAKVIGTARIPAKN